MNSYIVSQIQNTTAIMTQMLEDSVLLATIGEIAGQCAKALRSGNSTPKIQEGHIVIGPILCGLVENALFGS